MYVMYDKNKKIYNHSIHAYGVGTLGNKKKKQLMRFPG